MLSLLLLQLPSSLLSLFFFFSFIPTCLSQDDPSYTNCSPLPFKCGNTNYEIRYPFRIEGDTNRPDYCSYPGFNLTCNDKHLVAEAPLDRFNIKSIDYDKLVLRIVDNDFTSNDVCPWPSRNSTIDSSPIRISWGDATHEIFPFNYTSEVQNVTLYNCSSQIHELSGDFLPLSCLTGNGRYAYFTTQQPERLENCNAPVIIPLQRKDVDQLFEGGTRFGDVLDRGFDVRWMVDIEWCKVCERSGGRCGYNEATPLESTCFCREGRQISHCSSNASRKKTMKIIIGITAATGGCLITCVIMYLWYRKKRLISSSLKLISRTISSDQSSKSALGSCYSLSLLPTHVFSYKELEEATNKFDPSKELGEGGFGTVYHGKLYDGRSVAVKRLYESNCRRVEQFMNEIEILSRLRHQNLVSLYGCTSRHSRELLLVYEYISNGTVADHLHGNHAKSGALTWPIRMNIAIETADALSYLHAVEIIHRDVKTNNILLDNNFEVKVADFGLSRLFPMDKTHVSTAPQGTPGYVDPDYHRCYQLNDKSDVYSFGVVLFELISSKPAVDITRHRHEINLSNMAITKIHNNALHELVDPNLEFKSDNVVRRMITLVAELAFRCLHDEKEMRPSMEEVLKVLREIGSNEYKVDKVEDVMQLKNVPPFSPDSVTTPWISRNTTPNASG